VHLVAVDPLAPGGLVHAYETVRAELAAHGGGLEGLPELLVLSKSDLAPPEQLDELVCELRERTGGPALAISSATGAGLDQLRGAIFGAVAAEPARVSEDVPFDAEHATYRPASEQGFDILREGDAFRVHGRGIELLVARHDLSNLEALSYLESRLREIGVIAALERAGFEPGDEVRIGDEEFELDPG
jgi:GTPase